VLHRASRIRSPIGIPRLLFITRNNRRVRGLPAGCQHGARQANGSRVHQIVSFLERCPVLAGVCRLLLYIFAPEPKGFVAGDDI
jgi:hypothetical protein